MSEPDEGLELAHLTWPEARARFGTKLVCLLPIGATEPHGPHLPLATDVTIARAQALRAATLFRERGVDALVLPPLAYGLTRFTEGFEGRVTLRPGTLWSLLEDIVQSVEEQGVRHVVFVNAHLEPEHVAILRGVAADCEGGPPHRARILFADNTRRRWAEALGGEFQSGDCHAGRYESSIVLAADPGSVREGARDGLDPVRIDLIQKMKSGVTSFLAAGAEEAYCGDPAAASAEEGSRHLDTLARLTVDMALEAWPHLAP